MPQDSIRIALYDGLPDVGHRRWLTEPVAVALADLGAQVAVLRPEGTGREPDDRPTRIAVPPARVGEPLRPFVRDVWHARGPLGVALDAAGRFGADVFVDMEMDDRFWLHRRSGREMRFVGVLHGAAQLQPGFGRRHPLRQVLHRLRTRAFAAAFAAADEIVCFRSPVADAVTTLAPRTPVRVAGYPVVANGDLADPTAQPSPRDGADRWLRILVPGHVRDDKGLAELLGALHGLTRPVAVEVVGAQSRGFETPDAPPPHRVTVDDRAVDEDEMAAAHRRADLVLAPVPEPFAATGRARGTLLKAAAFGAAVVTTTAGLAQLPAGYGAVVVEPFDAASLRRALEDLRDTTEVRATAHRLGPPYVRGDHTFETFAAALLEASLGKRTGPVTSRRSTPSD